jgi:hypothetical protein
VAEVLHPRAVLHSYDPLSGQSYAAVKEALVASPLTLADSMVSHLITSCSSACTVDLFKLVIAAVYEVFNERHSAYGSLIEWRPKSAYTMLRPCTAL